MGLLPARPGPVSREAALGFGGSSVPCASTRCHEGELSRGPAAPRRLQRCPMQMHCLRQGVQPLLPKRARLRGPGCGSIRPWRRRLAMPGTALGMLWDWHR